MIALPVFKNIELRKALALAFDFEWTNKTLFYGQYIRSNSYFSNSELAWAIVNFVSSIADKYSILS